MSKNKKSNKRTNRKANARKSLKGKWGHIGAPPKDMKYPNRPFTYAQLFDMNGGKKGVCQLTARKNVKAAVAAGTLIALAPVKQKGGSVGRPKERFVKKELFDASKMELAPAKTVKADTTSPVVVTPPTPAPVVETPIVETTPAAPLCETCLVESSVSNPLPEAPATPISEPVIESPASPTPAPVIVSEPVTELAPVS